MSVKRVFSPRSNRTFFSPFVRNRWTTTSIKFVLNRATWRSGMENVISRVETVERTRVESIPPSVGDTVFTLAREIRICCRYRCPPVNRSTRPTDRWCSANEARNAGKKCKHFPLSSRSTKRFPLNMCTCVCIYIYIFLYIFFFTFFPSFYHRLLAN